MGKNTPASIFVIGIVIFLLAACRSGPTTPTPTAIPAQPGEMRLVAGCDPRDVDDWTEATSYFIDTFGQLTDRAADASPDELASILEDMRVYKASIDALRVPADCVQEVHQLVSVMVVEVINTFDARLADPNVDTRAVVTRAHATIQLVQARITDLTVAMEATYEAKGP